jgi:hypothetical protein
MTEHETNEESSWPSAVTPGDGHRPKPGDIVIEPNLAFAPEPLVGDAVDNALAEDESETTIPEGPLLAMKDHRHTQWHLLASHERHERVRESIAVGGDVLYVIDDGRTHAMLGRIIGTSPSCTYSLVGRVTREDLASIKVGQVPFAEAFATAEELALVGMANVDAVASTNVFDVAYFDSPGEVPQTYLPGEPALIFNGDLEITAY